MIPISVISDHFADTHLWFLLYSSHGKSIVSFHPSLEGLGAWSGAGAGFYWQTLKGKALLCSATNGPRLQGAIKILFTTSIWRIWRHKLLFGLKIVRDDSLLELLWSHLAPGEVCTSLSHLPSYKSFWCVQMIVNINISESSEQISAKGHTASSPIHFIRLGVAREGELIGNPYWRETQFISFMLHSTPLWIISKVLLDLEAPCSSLFIHTYNIIVKVHSDEGLMRWHI